MVILIYGWNYRQRYFESTEEVRLKWLQKIYVCDMHTTSDYLILKKVPWLTKNAETIVSSFKKKLILESVRSANCGDEMAVIPRTFRYSWATVKNVNVILIFNIQPWGAPTIRVSTRMNCAFTTIVQLRNFVPRLGLYRWASTDLSQFVKQKAN